MTVFRHFFSQNDQWRIVQSPRVALARFLAVWRADGMPLPFMPVWTRFGDIYQTSTCMWTCFDKQVTQALVSGWMHSDYQAPRLLTLSRSRLVGGAVVTEAHELTKLAAVRTLQAILFENSFRQHRQLQQWCRGPKEYTVCPWEVARVRFLQVVKRTRCPGVRVGVVVWSCAVMLIAKPWH